jgi:prevent-host-death family protein
MERTVDAGEALRRMDDLLTYVVTRGDRLIVERQGTRVAAVIPIALYDEWMGPRKEATRLLREMAEQADMTEDEAMELALEAVRAVREHG